MLLEVRVVATGKVIAEVRAAALGSGECGNQNGVANAAEGLRFARRRLVAPRRRDFGYGASQAA